MPGLSDLNKSSLLYWWPRINWLPISQPKTIIVPVDVHALSEFWDQGIEDPLKPFIPQLEAAGSEIGYPLFLRTDILSAKHDYENTCYVASEEVLLHHVYALAEMNFMILGPGPSALVFREYIPLASRFTAFSGNLPIAPERRYFVRDGTGQCSHPYWPLSAIEDASVPNWRELLAEMNQRRASHTGLLGFYARKAGKALGGYWSVDFALSKDGRWLLIDCAEGEKSYHWEGCEYASTER